MLVSQQVFQKSQRRCEENETFDFLRMTAALALGIPYKEVTEEQRREAKVAPFMWMYGTFLKAKEL